ncbi:MAG: hypothetical protein R3E54_16030 [Halioglobus sp.]
MTFRYRFTQAALFGAALLCSGLAQADLIDPTRFSANLAIGQSITISKTVIVEADPTLPRPGEAIVDLMFMFDVSGSMGGEIADAKAVGTAALGNLAATYNLMSGIGWYSDPEFNGVHKDLNGTNTQESAGIADLWDSGSCTVAGVFIGCGGDFPELGFDAIVDAANNASWRDGSNRFIFTLGDASFKPGGETSASAAAALAANNVSLLGLTYDPAFASSVQSLIDGSGIEGRVSTEGFSLLELVGEKAAGLYNRVTVDDFLGGMPGVDVSAVCTRADPGVDGNGRCAGARATGNFDRSVDRSFTYDVTFTALKAGVYEFDTFGLVNGRPVATERDRITVGNVPIPSTFLLLALGITGLLTRRAR